MVTLNGRVGFSTRKHAWSTSNMRMYPPIYNNQSAFLCGMSALYRTSRYDHGINTFDTANVYSNGVSETMLGNAIKELKLPREELVIMTKVRSSSSENLPSFPADIVGHSLAPGSSRPPFKKGSRQLFINPDEVGLVNQWGLNRKTIFASVKASLERLQLDYIDLYQCMFSLLPRTAITGGGISE